MSAHGTGADYIGRVFDLLALRGGAPNSSAPLSQTLFGADAAGEVCTGVQKLAQRWVLHFLTIRGSMPFLDRGCDFMLEARQGLLRTEADVETAFTIATAEVERDMQNEEPLTAPADERLESATLLSIGLLGQSLELRVEITSVAGTSARVILPVSFLPIRTGV